ncbi:MAG: hypothetical protein IJI68_10520 [Eggerthellaceae bacterium]|nr:hypothetical protein [Eggerthellaceae bacterium]
MKCVNCGIELAEDLSFCTNCGTPVAVTDAAQATVSPSELGSSLASAVEANQEVIDEIESHGEIADEAAARWAEAADEAQVDTPSLSDAYQPPSAGQPEAPAGYQPPSYGQPASQSQDVAAGAAAAAAGAASVPFYQQGASPNAHYSSQRSYDENPYGQDVGQQGQPAYQQPSYYQGPQSQAEQKVWPDQSATKRAFAMTLYVAGLLGLIFGLAVRDKNDEFITHHLNNVAIITIGIVIASFLSAIIIGVFLGIYLLVMAIMGIVSAYNGTMEELPLIGKIHIVK